MLLYLLLSDKSDDESDKLGSEYGSSSTFTFCNFSFCFDQSIVGVLGYDIFALRRTVSHSTVCASTVCTRTVFWDTVQYNTVQSIVGVLGYDIFAPTGVESKGGIFESTIFVPTGVDPKGSRLLAIFWRSISLFFL